MVDTAIDAMTDWMRSGRTANEGGAFPHAHGERGDRRGGAGEPSARLLGGEPRGVAFGPSMTAHDDALLGGRGSRRSHPGDEIVCTRLDHDANVRPWLIAAERAGATVRFAEPEPDTLELPATAVEAVLSDRTRWVAVTAASNAVGTVPDLPGIVAAARGVGARVYVDAVHASPHRPLDVAALGVDALACSAYKWFGPHIGVLCGRAGAARRAPAGQAAPLAGRGARPLGAGHAAVRGAGRRRRGRRLRPLARLGRRSARTRTRCWPRRSRGSRAIERRDALRRRAATARRR